MVTRPKGYNGGYPGIMPSQWTDFVDVASRLDSTINFTLVRFIYTLSKTYLSNSDILLTATVTLIFSNLFQVQRQHMRLVLEIMSSLGSGVLGQALINSATRNEILLKTHLSTPSRLLEEFSVVTCMLLLASLIPEKIQQKEYVSRALTILLYMYTDASNNIIAQLNFSWLPPFICGLLYIFLQKYRLKLEQNHTVYYLVKAFNMVSVNILITSISLIDKDASDLHTDTALLIITLFVIDALTQFSPSFLESRNFAIWKGAQQLFLVYGEMHVDTYVTFAIAFLVLLVHTTESKSLSLIRFSNSTLVEIFLLVVVNLIIDQLAQYTTRVYNMEQAFILFIYIISIHAASLFFSKQRDEILKSQD